MSTRSKKKSIDNYLYCYTTTTEQGEVTLHGPYQGLSRTQDESLNYYTDDDVFEVFQLVSVGHYVPKTTTRYIKQ